MPDDLIKKALLAGRESKHVEFKQGFDPNSSEEWCNIIKDIVAIANSGGGIIVFGLDSLGKPTGIPITAISAIDPADISNKIGKYTGPIDLEFEIHQLKKAGYPLVAFLIQSLSIPIVFQKPGTFEVIPGKPKTIFNVGTIYFRHGAKSEPGTSDDIRKAIDRQLEHIRKSWIKGVRKVVQAPGAIQVVTLAPPAGSAAGQLTFRAVKDPKATAIRLTRDLKASSGTFVHEEVSDGIFDEINNVIDANRALARGQQHFFLGLPVYYRIYAERHHVAQSEADILVLLHSAIFDLYGPNLFWITKLQPPQAAQVFAKLYLQPKIPHIHCLIRLAVLIGNPFCEWLYGKWSKKWKAHPQPPSFYWTFKEMKSKMNCVDPRTLAARVTPSSKVKLNRQDVIGVPELLQKPALAASLLSTACMRVFEGDHDARAVARELDYFAYGVELTAKSAQISKAIIDTVGEQEAGDVVETKEED